MLKDAYIQSPVTFLSVSPLNEKIYMVTYEDKRPIIINEAPPELAENSGMPIGILRLFLTYN